MIFSVLQGFFLGEELIIHWRQSSWNFLDPMFSDEDFAHTGFPLCPPDREFSAIRSSISGPRRLIKVFIARPFLVVNAATVLTMLDYEKRKQRGKTTNGASRFGVTCSTSAVKKTSSGY